MGEPLLDVIWEFEMTRFWASPFHYKEKALQVLREDRQCLREELERTQHALADVCVCVSCGRVRISKNCCFASTPKSRGALTSRETRCGFVSSVGSTTPTPPRAVSRV